jgi:glycolate dehydrogenase FAD-linked subunit
MSGLVMPDPDAKVLGRRQEIVAALRRIVPGEGVIAAERELRPYECDGLTAYRQVPMVVVLPETTAQVAAVLRYCYQEGIKVVPRGAGTSLSGGALPLGDGVLLCMAKFNRIREIDLDNRVVVAEPGVTNLAVTQAVEHEGLYYAPDPSSQIACTIGGNVAENAGGVHCLKYGVTGNNILGVEMVLITGEIITLGGKHFDSAGYDLLGIVTGSEGLLGVVTEVTVRVLSKPETARALLVGFLLSENAGDCVAGILGAGIIPGGLEMMDRLAIHAAEDFAHAGYPLDVEALLIVELDGVEAEVDHLIARVSEIARRCHSTMLRVSTSEEERLAFWAGRKAAFPAVGRISPDYYCMDGTIPRAKLPHVLHRMREMSEKYGLRVANVFHAGDGNLHPLILYDANRPGELQRTEAFGAEILKLCVEVGGVLTGEHGVGVEKRDLMPAMFNEIDLNQQQRLKCAFDDKGLLNPGKVFPTLHRCAELGRMHVHSGQLPFPDIPRF